MANPNPSPATRLGQPGGPPPGKRTGQRALEMQNAEAAMRIRARLLQAVENTIAQGEGDAHVMAMVEAAMLKLLTDSETRGLGAPVQKVDHSGEMAITSITRKIIDPKGD